VRQRRENATAQTLARNALLCQILELVPVIEPAALISGSLVACPSSDGTGAMLGVIQEP
jgi:fructose-bisphosphate aldolase class 1